MKNPPENLQELVEYLRYNINNSDSDRQEVLKLYRNEGIKLLESLQFTGINSSLSNKYLKCSSCIYLPKGNNSTTCIYCINGCAYCRDVEI
jgi:hypothetical protein